MSQLAVGGILSSVGLSLVLASGCGGNAFSASGGGAGEANGGSGNASAGGMSAGDTSTGGTSVGGASSGGASSGGASSGGASSGGASSGGASSGGAGGGCATGTVTFKMVPPKDAAMGSFCSAGCGSSWLSVTNADGKAVTLDKSCGLAACDTCMSNACPPVACISQVVTAEGLKRAWDETQWLGSTCGAMAMTCTAAHCVPPGKYKAKMCATKNSSPDGNFCSPGGTPTCTEVEFELPGATTVQGTISG